MPTSVPRSKHIRDLISKRANDGDAIDTENKVDSAMATATGTGTDLNDDDDALDQVERVEFPLDQTTGFLSSETPLPSTRVKDIAATTSLPPKNISFIKHHCRRPLQQRIKALV